MALLVCVLCQPVHIHALRHPYISYRFLFRNLFMETCFCYGAVPPTRLRLMMMCHPRTTVASNSQYTLPPQSSPQERGGDNSPSYAQSKAQMNHPQRISWLLVAISNATPSCYGARLAKEKNDSDFRPFQVCHFKNSYYTLLLLLQTGASSISSSNGVLLDARIFPWRWYCHENANTLIVSRGTTDFATRKPSGHCSR